MLVNRARPDGGWKIACTAGAHSSILADARAASHDEWGICVDRASRAALASLYAHLARAFAELVRVLFEVRRLSGDWPGLDPLERHDLLLADARAVVAVGEDPFAGAILVPTPTRAQ